MHYLASRFVEGETLADQLERDGPVPPQLVRIAAELGTGLDALHEAGLVHRDIKPSNVMLGADGAALTDFGLARGLADSVLTAPGRVVGTLDYLAPEVIRGQTAGPAADIYALGCLLYECVCGSPPFGSRPFAEAAAAHLTEEPDPCGIRDDLPLAFWDALRHGLAKDPADRPPTATRLRAHDPRLSEDELARRARRRAGRRSGRPARSAAPRLPRACGSWRRRSTQPPGRSRRRRSRSGFSVASATNRRTSRSGVVAPRSQRETVIGSTSTSGQLPLLPPPSRPEPHDPPAELGLCVMRHRQHYNRRSLIFTRP